MGERSVKNPCMIDFSHENRVKTKKADAGKHAVRYAIKGFCPEYGIYCKFLRKGYGYLV